MSDFGKLMLFLFSLYGAYRAVRTAWSLGVELFG
jgi:hypothetical protein